MNISEVESEIRKIVLNLSGMPAVDSDYTSQRLVELGLKESWSDTESQELDFFCRKYDIAKRLLYRYRDNGRGILDSGEVSSSVYELFLGLIILDLIYLYKTKRNQFSLRRQNTFYKILDRGSPAWVSGDSALAIALAPIEARLLSSQPLSHLVDAPNVVPLALSKKMKVIPLTVLFYEGPIARAYLETMLSLNVRPQRIVHLVPARDVQTDKKLGRWLPRGIRANFAASVHRSKIHYWPKQLEKRHSQFCERIFSEVSTVLRFGEDIQKSARALEPLEKYSDSTEQIVIDGLADPRLLRFLEGGVSSNILFTGGGIVPENLLEMPNNRFIHIHPGYLPYIRGADCALWSQLLSGHMSASCFFMEPGIDTGKVVKAMWMPPLSFSSCEKDVAHRTYYRAIYSFVDPWIRSYVFRQVILEHSDLNNVVALPQAGLKEGAYNFMHEKISSRVADTIFQSRN